MQRRREAEKEKQEKIQFGLMDKPEPKGKHRILNNLRVAFRVESDWLE